MFDLVDEDVYWERKSRSVYLYSSLYNLGPMFRFRLLSGVIGPLLSCSFILFADTSPLGRDNLL